MRAFISVVVAASLLLNPARSCANSEQPRNRGVPNDRTHGAQRAVAVA